MTTAERVLAALQAYDLKQERRGKYRCNSPLRVGSNSHGFTLTIDEGGENGAFYDHVTGAKGSLYDLADYLGIERPIGGRPPVADTKRAYRDLADYAAAHGVTPDVLKGWGDVIEYQGRPALPFKTPSGTRYRFIDGKKPYYKSELGYKACWYGLRSALAMKQASWEPLVLCNGEVSTLVAQHYGIPAACVTSGEKEIPPDLIAELKDAYPAGDIYLAYDCDNTGRKTAAAVHAQLKDTYAVTVIDLGLGDKGDLADFCMLHGDGAMLALSERANMPPEQIAPALESDEPVLALAASMKELSAAIRADERSRESIDLDVMLAKVQADIDRVSMLKAQPLVKSFEQLASENLAMLDYMLANPDPVRGLRSHIPSLDKAIGGFTPEVYVIYGATGMGKSTLAVSIAREFIKQAPGLIVSTESPPARWLTKLVASLTKIPSDLIESGRLTGEQVRLVKQTYEQLRDHKCHMVDAPSPTPNQVRAAFLDGQKKYGYGWLIVDSGSKMSAPGATAIYDVTRAVSNGLQDIYREANVPVIVTSQIGRDVSDHSRRGKRMPQLNDGYGGGPIEHNAGVVIGLYFHQYYVDVGLEDPNPDFPPDVTVARILKSRWNPGGRVSSIRLKFVGGAGFYELAPPKTYDEYAEEYHLRSRGIERQVQGADR